jgi:phage gpG-like protein
MIEIKIDDREVQRMLKDLSGKGKNMRPVMRNVAGIMHDAVEENFEQEGRPKWKPSKRADTWQGTTAFKPENMKYLDSMREGTLLYVRE